MAHKFCFDKSRLSRARACCVVAVWFAALFGVQVARAQWVAQGHDAQFTMYLPQSKKADTNAVFVISYERRWACKPSVSVLLVVGRKLGLPQRQDVSKNRAEQLEIVVDGRKFSAWTKTTIYSNAMEMAMFAPPGLVKALSAQPKTVRAFVGSGMGGFDFSGGTNFNGANAAAQAACS